jgi:hypothetical protein
MIAGLLAGALLFVFLGLLVWLVNRLAEDEPETYPEKPVLTWM